MSLYRYIIVARTGMGSVCLRRAHRMRFYRLLFSFLRPAASMSTHIIVRSYTVAQGAMCFNKTFWRWQLMIKRVLNVQAHTHCNEK